MSTIASLLARLELDTTGFQKGLKGIPGMLNNVGDNMTQIGGSISRGVTLPLLAAGAGVIAFGVDALKTGADFEKAMSGVSAILGATATEQKQLNDLAINLGMDPNLIVTASEAAGVMEELAKNGLSTKDILGGGAESAIALANATGTDFATAAQIASTSMGLFNIDAENMGKVVDQVTAIANNSRFTAEDFAQAVGQGGAAAKNAGVEFEEYTAVIAAVADYTNSGSDAGTSFKSFLTHLVPTTDKATEAMMDLGMITEDGQNAFFDAEGNMKSMAEVAGILEQSLSGLSQEQRISALRTIFESDASRVAIGLMETGKEGFEDLMSTMAKTDAAANAATRMDNLAGATEIAGGIMEGFKIKFTQAIGPGARTMVESFSNFLTTNSGSIENLFLPLSVLFDNFGKNFGPWLAENGPKMIDFLGKLIEALPDVVTKLSELGTAAAPQMKRLFDAFMEMDPNTIVQIMEAIGTVAALGPILMAIGGILTTISSVVTLVSTVGPVVGGMATAFWTAATAIGGFIAGSILLPLLVIIGTVVLVYLAFKNNFMGITTTVQQIGFLIKFYFEQMANWMLTNIKTAGDFIVTKFNEVKTTVQNLKGIFDAVMNGIRDAIGRVITKVVEMAAKLVSLVIPSWLTPGSPTPLEMGLKGIASAMSKVNSIGLAGLSSVEAPSMSASASKGLSRKGEESFSGGSKSVVVNITNPKKETSEESVRKTLNKLSYLRVLE